MKFSIDLAYSYFNNNSNKISDDYYSFLILYGYLGDAFDRARFVTKDIINYHWKKGTLGRNKLSIL